MKSNYLLLKGWLLKTWLHWFSSVQLLSLVRLSATPWTATCQASLSITKSWSLLKLMSVELWCHPTILFSVVPFSCLQSFSAWGSFLMNQFFASGDQSIEVSASTSVLPMNTQDWSPSEWTGWTSLQSKGLSRVFSNTTFHKHQFFSAILYLLGIYCLESPLECVLQKRRVFVLFIPNAEYPEMDMVYRRNVITGCMKEWIHADIHMMSLEICL